MSFIPTQYNDPVFVYSLRRLVQNYNDPIVRVIRESDHVEVDVYADSNEEVSYDSVIARTNDTEATVLGEFLNIDGYTDADGLGEVYEGRLSKIYDQSAGAFDVGVDTYSVSFLFVETNLPAYGGSTAIHKVNGVPAFFATATQPMFKLAQARGREVSYHFMTEGVGATQYFGFIEGTNTYRIWGVHDVQLEETIATLLPNTQWSVNNVYFDSEQASLSSGVYSADTFNNFESVITTFEAQLLDTATTQTAFPDNEVTFRVMSNNWYCDIVAFDGYDPIRRITIEQLYAQAASNTTAFAKTSSLLINNENPNQSGFLAQFPNAAAAYSVRSLTGNTGTNGPKIVRVRRDSDNVEVDVYTDNTGFITLDSPILYAPAITGGIDGGTGAELETEAETLGDFVFATGYGNPDNLASADTAKVVVWYDQSDTNYSLSNLPADIEERGAPIRIRVVGGTYANYEFDVYFDENETISLSSYVADTYEISDGATQVTANLSSGTLQTLVDQGMTSARVVVWYDQSSNGNDASQDVAASQPIIYANEVIVTENGKPALDFAAISHFDLVNYINPTANTTYTLSGVARPDVNDNLMVNLTDGTELMSWAYGRTAGNLTARTFDGATVSDTSGAIAINTQFLGFSIHDFTSVFTSLYINGGAATGTNAGRGDLAQSTIGDGPLSSLQFDGAWQEIVLWNSGQSANRTGIEATINNYYDIYDTGNTGGNIKTLDVFPDAAAAYSLRKLREGYSGPVNLSNRKDAKQQVSTSQPTLVSSGELVKENGKAALSFTTSNKMFVSTPSVFDDTNEFSAFSLISPRLDEFTLGFFWSLTDTNGGDIVLLHSTSELLSFCAYPPLVGARINNVSISSNQYLVHTESGQNARLDVNLEDNSGTVDINTFSKAVILEINNKENLKASCNYQELVFYTSSQQNERPNIESNINSAFQIYSAAFPSALDTVPLAKAAYSIRRLTKNYIDPIITVTNGSTTKDFYADFWGNLDVDALTSFANGGTLSVTKWWDQSGREDHLLATATNKPTLTISNGEVSVNTNNKFDTLLLDEYDGAAAAYSLRQIKRSYEGPLVRVRRDGTNTEVDVYPDENLTISLNSPVLNVAEDTTDVTANPQDTSATTLGEFVADAGNDPDGLGATVSAFVVVWYDQANSNSASQDISTSQPKIYDSVNGVVLENGKPAVEFNGSTTKLTSAFSVLNQPNTIFSTAATYNISTLGLLYDDDDGNNRNTLSVEATGLVAAYAGAAINGASWSINTQTLHAALYNSTSSSIHRNGTQTATGNVGTQGLSGLTFGARYSGNHWNGNAQELIIYNSDQSSNRTNIEASINNHYQIPSFNATASTAQTVAVYNNAINTTVDLNATYTDLKEIIKYE